MLVNRRRVALVILPFAAAAIVIAGSVSGDSDPKIAADSLRFSATTLDGTPFDFPAETLDGRVVLVDIWGTWCPPCLSEMPTFQALHEEFGDDGLTILGVAFEEGEADAARERLQAFVSDRGAGYTILYGGSPGDVQNAFPDMKGFTGFPVELLVGRDGAIHFVRNGYGYKRRWEKRLRREIAHALEAPER
jgi:thiol-disulfide isomerase/thioredoxin